MIRTGRKYISHFNSLPQSQSKLFIPQSAAFYTSTFGKLAKYNPSDYIPKNVLEPYHNASKQPEFGRPADKKPFMLELKKGKKYYWCLCGWSKHQPFCDGTHRDILMKVTLKPLTFEVEKDGTYWLCNCKQTKHRPFCDGSHKAEEIQEKFKFQ